MTQNADIAANYQIERIRTLNISVDIEEYDQIVHIGDNLVAAIVSETGLSILDTTRSPPDVAKFPYGDLCTISAIPTKKLVAAHSKKKIVFLFDLTDLSSIGTMKFKTRGLVRSITTCADGKLVFAEKTKSGTDLSFWQLVGIEISEVKRIENAHASKICEVATIIGDEIASRCETQIKIWSASGEFLRKMDLGERRVVMMESGLVCRCGERFEVKSYNDMSVRGTVLVGRDIDGFRRLSNGFLAVYFDGFIGLFEPHNWTLVVTIPMMVFRNRPNQVATFLTPSDFEHLNDNRIAVSIMNIMQVVDFNGNPTESDQ